MRMFLVASMLCLHVAEKIPVALASNVSLAQRADNLSDTVQKMLMALHKHIPDGMCKSRLTVRQLSVFVRSLCLKKWPLSGMLRLLNHDYHCTIEELKKIINYAPWQWWYKLICNCADGFVFYLEMSAVTKVRTNKRFISDFYFKFVTTYKRSCNVNQVLALSRYKHRAASFRPWAVTKSHLDWLFKSVCSGLDDERAVFNSKVVLGLEDVIKSHPVHVVNMYRYCSPTIFHPWTVGDVLIWLQNCTKFHRPDCSQNYCNMISMASQLGCEPTPCFRNVMIIGSSYKQTQRELVSAFKDLIEMKAFKHNLELFYDVFEKTIIFAMMEENAEKLYRVANPRFFANPAFRLTRATKKGQQPVQDNDYLDNRMDNDTSEMYPILEEVSLPNSSISESSDMASPPPPIVARFCWPRIENQDKLVEDSNYDNGYEDSGIDGDG